MISIAQWLHDHKWLYYILSWTWGFVMSFIGSIVILVLLCCGKKPVRYNGTIYVAVGKRWGGLELGMFFICDEFQSTGTKQHELGHTYQHACWGLLFPFVIGIPSAIRYWYRTIFKITSPSYDAIWFEGEATLIGQHIAE